MVLLSVGTAAVVAASASPASRLGRVLGWRPLRWLGVRSYGIYLWHYPIIVLTTPANGGDSLARGALQVAASVTAAALSWHFIEEPDPARGLGPVVGCTCAATGWRAAGGRPDWGALAGPAAVAGRGAGCGAGRRLPAVVAPGTPPRRIGRREPVPAHPDRTGGPAPRPAARRRAPVAARPREAPARRAARSCTSATRPPTAWSRPPTCPTPRSGSPPSTRGWASRRFIPEISGARSIVETWQGFPNALHRRPAADRRTATTAAG